MLPLGSSQNIIKHVEMAFRFQLPVGNEGLFVVITTNQHYQCSKGNNYSQNPKDNHNDFVGTHRLHPLQRKRATQPRRLS